MRSHLRFPSLAALLALTLIAASAGPADAKTKRFKPLDFVPYSSSMNVIRSPIAIGSSSGSASFFAPLGLPAGAAITGFRFYSNGVAAGRGALIYRVAYGAGMTKMATVSSFDNVPDLNTPAETSGTLILPPADLVVDPASYVYLVEVGCSASTAVWAVEVDYAP